MKDDDVLGLILAAASETDEETWWWVCAACGLPEDTPMPAREDEEGPGWTIHLRRLLGEGLPSCDH